MYFSGLLLLFILVPMIELALLIEIGSLLGTWATVGLVIFTGVAGATLARIEGFRVLTNIQRDLAEGRMPAPYLLDGVMILLAAAVLITPGLLTDIAGFLLLLPAFRNVMKQYLRRKFEEKLRQSSGQVTYWQG